jgi:putative hydrolase of the HAD superfamily
MTHLVQISRSPQRPQISCVFFDAVGTLIHPDPPAGEVYATIGRRFGSRLTPDQTVSRFREAFALEEAADRAEGLRTCEARERSRWRNIVHRVLNDVDDAEGCFEELFVHFSRPESWRLDRSAADALDELSGRGFVLGLASNFDSRLRSVVAGLPRLAPIRHLVISSEVGWRKPAQGFFDALRCACAREAATILFVGDDRTNDYDGARAAGLRALLYDPNRRELSPDVARLEAIEDLLAVTATP